MLCYKRTGKTVKVFFNAVLEQLSGLKSYMKAIGADGEKSFIHAACDSFPTAMFLLCLLHTKKNIKRKLVEGLRMNEEESKQIFEDLFGSSFQTGLIEIDQADQFEGCAQALIGKWKHGKNKSRLQNILKLTKKSSLNIIFQKMPCLQQGLLTHQMERFSITPPNR